MKVRELMEALQDQDPEADVLQKFARRYFAISTVRWEDCVWRPGQSGDPGRHTMVVIGSTAENWRPVFGDEPC
jgi:hypothetical protein